MALVCGSKRAGVTVGLIWPFLAPPHIVLGHIWVMDIGLIQPRMHYLAFSPPHFVFPRLLFCVFSGLLLEQAGWWEEESDLDVACHVFTY